MNNLINVWKKLCQDNKFLKILSVIIALIIWIIIITIASPVNEKSFYRIPVDVSFEGSVPDRNGLMMILSDTGLTINVDVSGNRSSLVSVRASDITASLNFDAVTAPGIYSIPISVAVDNAGVTVKDISPNNHVIVQFVKVSTRELPIQIEYTSSYPAGYGEVSHEILPQSVTVTGPEDTVGMIDKAVVRINPSARISDYTETCPVHLLDAYGGNVERKNLTLGAESVDVSVSLTYTATLPFDVSLENTYGGNETYASVTFSPADVTLTGDDRAIKNLTKISLGEIKLENHKNGDAVSFSLPTISGVNYINAQPGDVVTATINLPDTVTIPFTFSSSELNMKNLLPGYTFLESYAVDIRLPQASAEQITNNEILLSATLVSEGKARISVALPSGIAYGVMGGYDVNVEAR